MSNESTIDAARFRDRLLDERKRLLRVVHPGADNRASDGSSDLLADTDNTADAATETFEVEKDMTLRQNARDMLERVEDALRKIDHGSYGICSSCGKVIPAGRLEALPSAIYCVPCQNRLEVF